MKRFIFALFFIGIHLIKLNAQQYWSRRYDFDAGNDYGTSAIALQDGLIVPSKSFCEGNTRNCTGMIKVDYQGNLLWRTIIYDTLAYQHFDAIAVRNDTLFMNASYLYAEDGTDLMLLEFDLAGTLIGQFSYEHPHPSQTSLSKEVIVNQDRMYVSFSYYDTAQFKAKGKIRAYDNNWNQLWELVPSSYSDDFRFISMEPTPDTGVVVISSSIKSGDVYVSVVRLDKNGQELWVRHLPYGFGPFGTNVLITPHPDGSCFGIWSIDYWEGSLLTPYPDLFFKLDASGNLVWQKIINEAQNFSDVFVASNGDVVACGYSQTEIPGEVPVTTGYVNRMDTNGETIWERRFLDLTDSGIYGNFEFGLELDNDDLVFGGKHIDTFPSPTSPDISNIWIVKVDSNGCFTPDCTDLFQVIVPTIEPQRTTFDVFAAFPNPFTNKLLLGTQLGQTLPTGKYYALIYDFQGHIVHPMKTVQPDDLTEFELNNQPAGMYIVQLFLDGKPLQTIKTLKK